MKAGALLVREWKGRLERVTILEEGFAWNGQTFGSLSQIAKAMTGTNWNGHRFFGLRQGKVDASGHGRDRRKGEANACARTAYGASLEGPLHVLDVLADVERLKRRLQALRAFQHVSTLL